MVTLKEACLRRKPDDSDTKADGEVLNRCLRLIDLVAIGAGTTLGAGVYVLAGKVATKNAGPAVVLCFTIAAIASILSGICYAELGCRVSRAGSGYAYLYATLGEFPAFVIGWCLLLSWVIGASSVASALVAYVNDMTGQWLSENMMWPKLGFGGLRDAFDWPSLIVIILLGALMCVGVQEVSKMTNVLLAVNILTIIVMVLVAMFDLSIQNWTYDTTFNSPQLPEFFANYYALTTGEEGVMVEKMDCANDGCMDDQKSFVQRYCASGVYQSEWFNETIEETQKTISHWRMKCQLDGSMSERVKVNDEGVAESINLETNYGSRKYKLEGVADNSTLIIEDSTPGVGGFMPYGFSGVATGTASCFYGFVGFDAIATTSEEAINPQKNIPKAIIFSLTIICVVYLSISGFITLNFPYFAMDPINPFASAFGWHGFGWIANFLRVGAIAALFASLIGGMIPMPRILYNMAEDGLVYEWAARVDPKTKIPKNATIIATLVAALLAAIFDLDVLVDFMSIGTLAAYAIVAMCVLVLRYRPDASDEGKPNTPTVEQGNRAEKLVFILSCAMFFGFAIAEKIVLGKTFVNMVGEGLSGKVYWVLMALVLLTTVYCVVVFSGMKESQKDISFKTPLLPYVPVITMILNLYMMASLEVGIWWKLFVWLAVGFFIYFTYGVKNSKEANRDQMVPLKPSPNGV